MFSKKLRYIVVNETTSMSNILQHIDKIYNNSKHAYAGQLNSFTHLRALLVLHDRGICWPGQQAASLGKRKVM
jgi:hypothetical protein